MSPDSGAPATPAPDAAPVIGDAWAYREDLVAYARRLLGAHGEMAEDVVQEAYLRLHECTATGAPVEEARPWLFRVARNLALDERRRGRRGDDVLSSLEVVSPGPRGPLEVLQAREEARQALEGLDALPPRERRTVILEQAGLAPPAIARRMHTTTNAVHQALFRARRRMRDARTAALGLLPLPLVRLVFRAASSPTLDRLPALAPGSGGRMAGGAGLAGLVAAAVIGGGAVADRPAVPSPPGPARAAAAAALTTGSTAAATTVAPSASLLPRASGISTVAVGLRAASGAAALSGVREAPARRADRGASAGGSRDDGPAPQRERVSGEDDDTDDDSRQGRGVRDEGDDAERGDHSARGDGEGAAARGARADRDEGGAQGAGARRRGGRDEGDDDDGSALSAAGSPSEAGSGTEPSRATGRAAEPPEAVSAPEPPADVPAPQEPRDEPPARGSPGGGVEPASEPPPAEPVGHS